MSYLSACGIIHRDLKPGNILLDSDFTPAITDYGISRMVSTLDFQYSLERGTPFYMSPELYRQSTKTYANEVDVFSYGIILWQLLTKREPYYDTNFKSKDELYQLVSNGRRPIIDITLDKSYNDLIILCWNGNHKLRPTFDEIYMILTDFITKLP